MTGTHFFAGIIIFILTGFTLAFLLLVIAKGISYRREEPEKRIPYECGELPVVPTKKAKFSANYYSYALAFLLFDVEAALLIPWVIAIREANWVGVYAGAVFLFILLVGLFFAFKSGGLRWE